MRLAAAGHAARDPDLSTIFCSAACPSALADLPSNIFDLIVDRLADPLFDREGHHRRQPVGRIRYAVKAHQHDRAGRPERPQHDAAGLPGAMMAGINLRATRKDLVLERIVDAPTSTVSPEVTRQGSLGPVPERCHPLARSAPRGTIE